MRSCEVKMQKFGFYSESNEKASGGFLKRSLRSLSLAQNLAAAPSLAMERPKSISGYKALHDPLSPTAVPQVSSPQLPPPYYFAPAH